MDRCYLPSLSPKQDHPNIRVAQNRALNKLKKRRDIVIKPADKGGQIVLQDRHDYLVEARRKLDNLKYYVPLQVPLQPATQELIKPIIQSLYYKKYISFKQMQYLLGPDPPSPRYFYLLPKIHKPPASWTVPHRIPSGRPIISDCGSETYRIAEFIDLHLNPLSNNKYTNYSTSP
uniref:Uncharacterized protein n=1 Tax=Salarias fasciatus TaxID=181472 RepID=A0A672H0C0_SALFA